MTASIAKVTSGDGYLYLTQQVAAADSTELGRQSLSDYYTAKGESPGVWVGRGLADLQYVSPGDAVSEAHMRALFGEGLQPEAERITSEMIASGASLVEAERAIRLGRRFASYNEATAFQVALAVAYRDHNGALGVPSRTPISDEDRAQIRSRVGREVFEQEYGRPPLDDRELTGFLTKAGRPEQTAVSGFDLTFSPVKSVSALWAIAPRPVSEAIEAAHRAAVGEAIRLVEEEVAFTRRGAGGVRHVETRGIAATMFEHRDSRAGDPDLHTHVAISNKVQAAEDGAWLALDGQVLYQSVVRVSERYNTALEGELSRRLGLTFVERESTSGRRTVREVEGLPTDLMTAWSSRRSAIERVSEELAAAFKAAHNRDPQVHERAKLFQQATLQTRPAKHEPRSLAEQRQTWREQAEGVLGADGVEAVLGRVREARVPRLGASDEQLEVLVAGVAQAALERVQASRSVFRVTHLAAEIERIVRARNLHPDQVGTVVERALRATQSDDAVQRVGWVDQVAEPLPLRRSDGTSVYVTPHSRLYTTSAVVEAESAILAAAQRVDGRRISAEQVGLSMLESVANGVELDPGQRAMVEALATSGARVQLALAPAGAGKTTAMRVLARAWRAGGGHLLGVGPSATAASELGDAIEATGDTISSLTYRLRRGLPLPEWARTVDESTLVVVDEAGMAGTTDLAAVVEFVTARGGSVRLIGDDQQLASVAAGGVLRDIASNVEHTVTLSQLWRFSDPSEAVATLALREGDVDVVGWYLDRGRVHTDPEGTVADRVLDAWIGDRSAGLSSLMMAYSVDQVRDLNVRARAHLVATGEVAAGPTVELREGQRASVGDLIITRTNDRGTRTSSTDWVKNGDRWTVVALEANGALAVRHARSGRRAVLSRRYVSASVDLGYACTVHTSQGSTVDVTRTLLTGAETRQLLYVAASRGRHENHLYVGSGSTGDPHEMLTPEQADPATATEVLETILRRDGAQLSVATAQADAENPAAILGTLTRIMADAPGRAALDVVGAARSAELINDVERMLPGVTDCGTWDALHARLLLLEAEQPGAALEAFAAAIQDDLGGARDRAAVVWGRLQENTQPGPLPWLAAPPRRLLEHPQWGPYLVARTTQVLETVDAVREHSLASDPADLPSWSRYLAHDRELVADLAVWRAAHEIPVDDPRPTGPPARDASRRRVQRGLDRRVTQLLGVGGASWVETVRQYEPRVLEDPFWEVLGRRLDVAAGTIDVPSALRSAFATGPLPDDHAAAALWYRLTPVLAPAAVRTGRQRLHPEWVDQVLTVQLPEQAESIQADPAWAELVAAVDQASRVTRTPSADLVSAAIALSDLEAVEVSAYTTVLAQRVSAIAHPPAVDEDPDVGMVDPLDMVDPSDLDAFRRGDLYAGDGTPSSMPLAPHAGAYSDGIASSTDGEVDAPSAAADPGTSVIRIVEINQVAADYWREQYAQSSARDYVAGRFGGSDLTDMDGLVIGYAPAGSTLVPHLRAAGVSDTEMVDAGLARWSRRGELVDLMRDRVVVGIHDTSGDLVGFVGRAAPASEAPKYINTPQTAAFTKGAVLFGMHESPLRDPDAVPVRVEGVFDAIAVTRAGDGTTYGVAPLGTALTSAQAELLAQTATTVLEGVDSDPAGRKAMAKDLGEFSKAGIEARQLVLSGEQAKDPAELFARDGGATLGRILDAGVAVAPSTASAVITGQIWDVADRIRENPILAYPLADDCGRVIASLPVDQWHEHGDLVGDVIAQVQDEPDPTFSREIANRALQSAIANQTSRPSPAVELPAAAVDSREVARRLDALIAAGATVPKQEREPDRPAAPEPPQVVREGPGRDL